MKRIDTETNEFIAAYGELFLNVHTHAVTTWLETELTFAQLKALVMLSHHQPLTVSALAKLLGVGNPAASILVQQVVALGLVERAEDPRDRRRTVLRLTEKGAVVLAGRREQQFTRLRQFVRQMDNTDRAALIRGMKALAKVARSAKDSSEKTPTPRKQQNPKA